MAVSRDRGHAQINAVLGIAVLDLMTAENNLSSVCFADVVDGIRQFLLAVSVNAGDTHDLSGPDLQVEVLDGIETLFIFYVQILDIQNDLFGLGRSLLDDQLDRVSDHLRRQLVLRDALYRDSVDIFASADDSTDVRRGLDLFELMGDDDNGLPVLDQVLHDRQKFIDLLLCQDCSGLVQDQDLRPAVQRLEDFYALLHTHGNIADAGVRIDLKPVFLNNVQNVLTRLLHVGQDTSVGLAAQDNVLGDGEILHQHEVLVHHSDPVLDRRRGILDIYFFAVDENFSLVRAVKPVEDIHQCAFAGAVLAQNRVDGSLLDIEFDVCECIKGPEALGDPMHLHSISVADFSSHVYLHSVNTVEAPAAGAGLIRCRAHRRSSLIRGVYPLRKISFRSVYFSVFRYSFSSSMEAGGTIFPSLISSPTSRACS